MSIPSYLLAQAPEKGEQIDFINPDFNPYISNYDWKTILSDSHVMPLYVIDSRLLELQARQFNYGMNKERLLDELRPILKKLQSGRLRISFINAATAQTEDLEYANHIIEDINVYASQMRKEKLVEFMALIKSHVFNFQSFIYHSADNTMSRTIIDMCARGALSLPQIAQALGLKAPDRQRVPHVRDIPYHDSWHDESFKFLRSLCNLFDAPHRESKYIGYFIGTIGIATPGPNLIIHSLLCKYFGAPATVFLNMDESAGGDADIFISSDILLDIPMIIGLFESGVVKRGKTKLPATSAKKINISCGYSMLKDADDRNPDRGMIIGSLIAQAIFNGHKLPPISNPAGLLSMMVMQLRRMDVEIVSMIFHGMTRKLPVNLLSHLSETGAIAVHSIDSLLRSLPDSKQNEWIDLNSIISMTEFGMALKGYGYIMPEDEYQKPEKVFYCDDSQFYFEDYLENFHRHMLKGIIRCMASIGMLDLAYDVDGTMIAIRMTRIGRYLEGLDDRLEFSCSKVGKSDDLSFDPASRLILVKNPDSPYISLLAELTVRVSPTRYAVSATSITKGCKSKHDVESNINRFRTFLVSESDPTLESIFRTALDDCDSVSRAPHGTEYTLYDVDYRNQRLMRLLTTDPDISQNTLKVEGGRLLVNDDFIPDFLAILRKNGFIND